MDIDPQKTEPTEPKEPNLDDLDDLEFLSRAYDAAAQLGDGEPEPQKTEPEPQGAAPVEPQEPQPQATPPKEPEPPVDTFKVDSPENWPTAAKEMYQSLPGDAQQFLMTRYKEMQAGHTKSMQELAEVRKQNESLSTAVEQWKPYMQSRQMDPSTVLDTAIRMEHTLSMGTQQEKRDFIKYLVHTYGITPSDGAPPPQNAPQNVPQQGAPQAGPQVVQQAVQQAVTPIYQHMNALLTKQRDDAYLSSVEQVRSEKDANGNPLRPYFDDVRQEMAALATSATTAGQPEETLDLRDLYSRALWMNPTTRARLVAQQDRANKAGAARQSSLTSGSGSPATPAESSKGSVEDDLRSVYDRLSQG